MGRIEEVYLGLLCERSDSGSDQMGGVRRHAISISTVQRCTFFVHANDHFDTLPDKLDLCSVSQASRSMYSRRICASLQRVGSVLKLNSAVVQIEVVDFQGICNPLSRASRGPHQRAL